MSIIQAAGSGEVSTGFYKHLLDQSLKFDDGKASVLKRTPASAGNRRTWTWSAWIKFGAMSHGTNQITLFDASSSSTEQHGIVYSGQKFYVFGYNNNFLYRKQLVAEHRDPSAWYHYVVAFDTTDSTAADRIKIYVNGTLQTALDSGSPNNTNPSENYEGGFNNAVAHGFGGRLYDGANYFDGYMAEINFIDGTALTAASFGETKDGIWVPKDTSGLTFGTNGFHLTFKDDVVSEGFNTGIWTGTGADNSISGIGFSPAFVWIKDRTDTAANYLFDVNRGALKDLYSSSNGAEYSASQTLKSFDGDGFTLGNNTGVNGSADDVVAWCWEGGGTPTATNSAGAGATPTAGSVKIDGSNLGSALAGTIPATKISANTARGFSIVGYEATGSAGTIAHGLSAAPELIIVKHRDQSGTSWPVYYGDNTDAMYLNSSGATSDDANAWNDTSPTSTVFSVGANGGDTNNSSGGSTIAYCFHSVSGYSKIGTFTGNGGSQAIDVGFEPAWVMLRRTNGSTWGIFDSLRGNSGSDRNLQMLAANSTAVETTNSQMTFSGNTFNDNGYLSDNGTTVLYMAFADTREAAFFKDVSTNGNHWVPVNLDYRDSVPDTPTNNFATFNPLLFNANVYSEGNLKNASAGDDWEIQVATMFPAGISGKWYAEFYVHTCDASSTRVGVGVTDANVNPENYLGEASPDVAYYDINDIYTGGSKTADSNLTFAAGDIISVALNLDDGEVTFRKNNSTMTNGTQNLIASTLYTFATSNFGSGAGVVANFGQDSSFAGNHATSNTNADGNGHGSFAYAPPSGFLALCSQNLPDVAIIDGTENFNTVLYTGNDTGSRAISGVGFLPDWLWIKNRTSSNSHALFDSLRGSGSNGFYRLATNLDTEEQDPTNVASLNADGFTLGSNTGTNGSGKSFVAWNWKINAGTESNVSAGGSSNIRLIGGGTADQAAVQANTTAGISIVGFENTVRAADGFCTFPHGLGSAPDMVWLKSRTGDNYWAIYHSALGLKLGFLGSSVGSNAFISSTFWNAVSSSTVKFQSNGNLSATNEDIVAYCFKNIEGYSKAGSYLGSGVADGPFIFTGFTPAFLLIKNSETNESWQLIDSTRSPHNVSNNVIYPNAAAEESAALAAANTDFLSNGFKIRAASGNTNDSGEIYIYLAFAESPFKFANAR